MRRIRPILAPLFPVAALVALATASLLMSAAPGEALAPQTQTVELIVTSDLWQTFYPTGPVNGEQSVTLRALLKKLVPSDGDKLVLDLGSFSGLTMLTETGYSAGALGVFIDNKFDAINLGRQESSMAAVELELLLRRGVDAGVTGFVSSFVQTETTYEAKWTPYINVTKNGMPFLIGGISGDVQDKIFLKAEPMFANIDNAAYAKKLFETAKETGAFPILLADADAPTVDAIAKSVEGLPLILNSAVADKVITRTVGRTLIIDRAAPNSIAQLSLEFNRRPYSATIKKQDSLGYGKTSGAPLSFWPAAIPHAAAMPPVALPDIGLPLDNKAWLSTLGLNSDTMDLNLITGMTTKFPTANASFHYYNVSPHDDPTSIHRLIYIRHQLPHPNPSIYFLVLTDDKGVIKRVFFPFGLILGARPSRLPDWAEGMTGANAAQLEQLLATQKLEYYQAVLMTDVYHTLKILEAGAI